MTHGEIINSLPLNSKNKKVHLSLCALQTYFDQSKTHPCHHLLNPLGKAWLSNMDSQSGVREG